jgi:alanine racemase
MSSKQATAHINLDALSQNFDYVKSLAPNSKVMAVIKADAYGHGAVKVAHALSGADAFGVARVSEAVKLREAGIGTPICLLEGVMDKEEINLASVYEFQIVVHSEHQLELLETASARRGIWLKVDTGMGRLGIAYDKAAATLNRLGHQTLQGLMTHLANASDPTDALTELQINRLQAVADASRQPNTNVLSLANSAGLLRHPASIADWVRPGLMLYGASPMDDLLEINALHPVMTFSAPVISVHKVKQGESVGYGGLWTTEKDARIAVIAAGYADGYPRETSQGTPVLINGVRRPLVGRVSMDMICVELEPEDQTDPGDTAVLWGEGLPVEEISRHAGTVPYTLLCGITNRVHRVHRGAQRKNQRGTQRGTQRGIDSRG